MLGMSGGTKTVWHVRQVFARKVRNTSEGLPSDQEACTRRQSPEADRVLLMAAEIKKVRASVPIVMLGEHAKLPGRALTFVGAVVSISDPPDFLWAAVPFVLNVTLGRDHESKGTGSTSRTSASSWKLTGRA